MKQSEATPERPFFSVCYQYTRNPWTFWSCNRFGKGKHGSGRTQQGTDDFTLAKAVAERLITEAGICYAQVTKSVDCYNHEKVFECGKVEVGR